MPIPIEILVADESLGSEAFFLPICKRAVEAACVVLGIEMEEELSIAIVDDAQIQRLNRTYRNKDKPTNVLSFPMEGPFLLGDLVLARPKIEVEAKDQGKKFSDHLTHLTLHGFLHLLGYDHESEKEASIMEGLEIEALAKLGIDNPYEINDSEK